MITTAELPAVGAMIELLEPHPLAGQRGRVVDRGTNADGEFVEIRLEGQYEIHLYDGELWRRRENR